MPLPEILNVMRQNIAASSASSRSAAGYTASGDVLRDVSTYPDLDPVQGDGGRLSLLTDPLITIRRNGKRERVTLPHLLELLCRDYHEETAEVESFEALQHHQRAPWYAFLSQLLAMGWEWDRMASVQPEFTDILKMIGGGTAAWHLISQKDTLPGFFQPPMPYDTAEHEADNALGAGQRTYETPMEISTLTTSKNHHLKRKTIRYSQPEHWMYALVELQTTTFYNGPGNYGIFRMNGGASIRPFLQPFDARGIGQIVPQAMALYDRINALDGSGYVRDEDLKMGLYSRTGHRLLWRLPWGPKSAKGGHERDERQIPLSSLHPYAIEVARRVRLRVDPGAEDESGAYTAETAGSAGIRVAVPDKLQGVTGDPFAPVDVGAGKLFVKHDPSDYRNASRTMFRYGGVDIPMPEAIHFAESTRHVQYPMSPYAR